MTDNPFKPQIDTPPEACDAALEEYRYYVPPGKQDFPLSSGKGERLSLWNVALHSTIALMLFNLVSVPIAEALDGPPGPWGLFIALIVGVYFTQAAALSTGLVFASVPFWQRLGLHWLIAVALVSVWLLGFQSPTVGRGAGPSGRDIAFVFLSLPLFSLAAQLPLWVLRLYFQWQIVHEEELRSAEPDRALSIRDLMIATVVVALSVALARVSAEQAGPDYWIVWAIVVLSVAGASLVSIPPLLVWTLRVKEPTWGALAALSYAVAFAIGSVFLMLIIEPRARPVSWQLFIFLCMIFGYAATLLIAFWILRVRGLRLKIGWSLFRPTHLRSQNAERKLNPL